jgi:hypothetical protein
MKFSPKIKYMVVRNSSGKECLYNLHHLQMAEINNNTIILHMAFGQSLQTFDTIDDAQRVFARIQNIMSE